MGDGPVILPQLMLNMDIRERCSEGRRFGSKAPRTAQHLHKSQVDRLDLSLLYDSTSRPASQSQLPQLKFAAQLQLQQL